jgi:hypothetical protein
MDCKYQNEIQDIKDDVKEIKKDIKDILKFKNSAMGVIIVLGAIIPILAQFIFKGVSK